MNPEDLQRLVTLAMPFGKRKGTVIADLPASGSYVVYCRSGNRSAQAVAQMEQLGFTDVFDAGGLDQAAASTGLDITTAP